MYRSGYICGCSPSLQSNIKSNFHLLATDRFCLASLRLNINPARVIFFQKSPAIAGRIKRLRANRLNLLELLRLGF
jgi:hypothetical protein